MRLLDRIWPLDVVIDPMTPDHAHRMSELHRLTFSRPWTDGEFSDLLAQKTVFGFVARELRRGKAQVLGFVLVREAAGEAEILTITVAPEWQGRGLGRKLMDSVLAKAHGERIEAIFLEVDETNQPALSLYRKLGFFQVGGRPDYYRDRLGRASAALVMRRDLG
ncbi:ribosomal protein S18-alanine N-acetyltransferase [Oricola cellulosilytica]|uniref:Ribosomal-protein-alanine N-acetyltransferase n=1 Tax=Oricola cellulosilytica TaxID=1429082 RepID=A0A4V2MP54_9HYPH|nr:ribosomal protein S18-alanine N-acetyltransferase [Oricola cellulosilytica]TCD16332.1 ribosomal-protein-alanine N-acetyltransferase [Oricola cellulosilytica]